MSDKPTVAVLGAGGTMGFAMARNLAKAGFSVRAWNRSREKAEPLGEDGAVIVDTPAEAVEGAQILLTMLTAADAVLDSAEPALAAHHEPGLLWLQMSTIGEEGTERCLELAGRQEVAFVDAPVSGTKEPAEQGKLVVLASGPLDACERARPIFDVVGQKTVIAGEQPGDGSKLKLAINAWLVSVVEGAAETLAFAAALGLDPQLVLETLEGGPLDLPYLQLKGKAMLEGNFEPSFKLRLAAKDAALVRDSVESRELDLPLLDVIRRRFEQGAEQHGEQDMSATYLTSSAHAPRAGRGPR
jgi:3-hydroxyisobutyrate dehydrogenase